MATEDAVGNVLRPPSTSGKGPTTDDEILGSYARLTQKGLTVLAGSGSLKSGTVLKESGTAGKYEGAAATDVDGTADAVIGVLRKDVDATDTDMLANYVVSGIVKAGKLKLADGTALDATQVDNLATALNGRVDTVHNYLIF